MDQFVLWGSYCEDALIKRAPFREEHLQRLSSLKKEGVLITLGPTKCNRYVFGIFKAEDIEYIRSLIKEDAYWREGIWTDFQVYSWTQAF
tara:strand:- start:1921 stop:2190 length:270 start_codon:yes stop_codon:yes gene_type:complete